MKFTTSGMNSIHTKIEDDTTLMDIVHTFGNRLARREFGKRGVCVLWRINAWSGNGRTNECECFIGIRTNDGWDGKNVQFTVNVE